LDKLLFIAGFCVIMCSSFSRDRKTPILCRLDGQNLEDYEGFDLNTDCLLCPICRNAPDILSSWKCFFLFAYVCSPFVTNISLFVTYLWISNENIHFFYFRLQTWNNSSWYFDSLLVFFLLLNAVPRGIFLLPMLSA
jgi:hypothetical protein